MKRTRPLTAVIACLAIPALSACGERTEPTAPTQRDKVNVVLAGRPDQADLCLFQAKESGAFSEAALDVNITVPRSLAAPFEMLGNDRADLIVAGPEALLIQRDGGAPYISVAKLTTTPIDRSGESRRGRERSKRAPGVGPEVLIATRTSASERGGMIRRFVQAAGRACSGGPGTLAPGRKALAAAARSYRSAPPADPVGGPPMTLPSGSRPWGWQPPEQWAALVEKLRRSGRLEVPTAPDTAYTNEFLAGEGA